MASNNVSQAAPSPKHQINLQRGWPSFSLLPADMLKSASGEVLSSRDIYTSALEYGPDAGYQPLRQEIADWLSPFYSIVPDVERITVSGGASQNIARLLQSYTDPSYTRAVWMVAPCYYLACQILADGGFAGRLRAVPEDAEGIDLEWLERGLQSMEADGKNASTPLYKDPRPFRKIYRHVVYCVPSFSNPSGTTMTLRRREALVQLARKYDALVITDDVYDMLQWPFDPDTPLAGKAPSEQPTTLTAPSTLKTALLPRLVDIDRPLGRTAHDPEGQHFGHAVSNGSFSKLVAPGVRTGWMESTPDFALGLSQTGSTASGGAPSQLAASIITEALRTGNLHRHIEGTLKPNYQWRHAVLLDAVNRLLVPLGAVVNKWSLDGERTFGGYFLWLSFPNGPAAKDIARVCRVHESLMVAQGSLFEVHGDTDAVRFDQDIRLCFSWMDLSDLVEGVERLARVVKGIQENGIDAYGTEEETQDARLAANATK